MAKMSAGLQVGGGMKGMLKDGYKHFSGLEQAILKNVQACNELSELTRTSLGPNGMDRWRHEGHVIDAC